MATRSPLTLTTKLSLWATNGHAWSRAALSFTVRFEVLPRPWTTKNTISALFHKKWSWQGWIYKQKGVTKRAPRLVRSVHQHWTSQCHSWSSWCRQISANIWLGGVYSHSGIFWALPVSLLLSSRTGSKWKANGVGGNRLLCIALETRGMQNQR